MILHNLKIVHDGFIYHHAVPSNTTGWYYVNGQYYVTVSCSMLQHYQRKHPNENVKEILLHHNNARSHVSHVVTEFLKEKSISTVLHPLYSPDLVPCDFRLFPSVKIELKNQNFSSDEEVLKAVEAIWKCGFCVCNIADTMKAVYSEAEGLLWKRLYTTGGINKCFVQYILSHYILLPPHTLNFYEVWLGLHMLHCLQKWKKKR